MLIICVLEGQPDRFDPWTVGGWLAGSSWLDLGPVTVDGWGRLKGLWRGPDG